MVLKGKTAALPPRTASVSKRVRLREVQNPLCSTIKEMKRTATEIDKF